MLQRGIIALLSLLVVAGCQVTPSRPVEVSLTPTTEDARPGIVIPPMRGQLYNDLRHFPDPPSGSAFDVDVSPDADIITYACDGYSIRPKIFTQKIGGGSPVQRTFGTGSDIQPKWSPDGKWIAFASDRDGDYDIYVVRADGSGGSWQVTHDGTDQLHPSWSPDATALAYCAQDPAGVWYLWRVKLEGSVHTQLVPGLFPEWSPDGERIAFQAPNPRGTGLDEIWVIGIDGQGLTPVMSSTEFGSVQPSWDPFGDRLVFASVTSPHEEPSKPARARDLWIVELEGGSHYQLTADAHQDYAPCWGLDGRVYFTSDRAGRHGIKSLEPVLVSPFTGPDTLFPKEGE